MEKNTIVAIDVGAISVSVIEMTFDKKIIKKIYEFHQGKINETLSRILSDIKNENQLYCCTSSSDDFFDYIKSYDNLSSIIEASKFYYTDLRSILHVGAEKFYYFRFDENGNFIDMKSSTSCAAGTGSFLDQQSKRLGLNSSAELAEIALKNDGNPPKIASRCSVFAKTDLIHAQQEGYTITEICDGICLGLANNVADTLFTHNPEPPIIFTGGVSKNKAVVKHLEKRINQKIEVHPDSHLFGAIGSALLFLKEKEEIKDKYKEFKLKKVNQEKLYYYPPIELKLSKYPDFTNYDSFIYRPERNLPDVEVEIFEKIENNKGIDCYMGIDIGSTSTKSIIIDRNGIPLVGLYTRTLGKPINATQALFSSIDNIQNKYSIKFNFISVGTTGSGRKFIGKIIGADLFLDEISAHAKAAYVLNPEIDTIIEIGGQDAKFTTMRNGVVTFSKMNTVCAAGTGSFIEEQAQKLGIKLSEIPSIVDNQKSPLASDRCTVFMERDINHFLSRNYSVNECMAAVLHSIRDNYLLKVAIEGAIGDKICFQGATAKNKALVAVFEQKLNKPIFVSKYCHLTGALGVAIVLKEENIEKTNFKGINIYKNEIPIRTEICQLCLNHCRIRIVNIENEEVAFGFLCGRDYNTNKYVPIDNKNNLFNLRKKALEEKNEKLPILGIPAGLQIFDEIIFWKEFFKKLGVPFVTSENLKDPVAIGKKLSGAEFCAPMSAIFGHAEYVSKQSDIVFLPVYIEDHPEGKNKERLRKYCYYSQLSSSIISQVIEEKNKKFIMPIIDYRKGYDKIIKELYNSLKNYYPHINYDIVSKAYNETLEYYNLYKERLRNLYEKPKKGEIKVALLGRPYTVLSQSMNKNIPDIFASLGVTVYYQDMLPLNDDPEIEMLMNAFHWSYASKILKGAIFAAKTEGLYPVLITSFKCAPDSFVQEYFTRILDNYNKPYLILQIDEHDSNVGYETRIEAALRSFRNHLFNTQVRKYNINLAYNPKVDTKLEDKILVLPNWDPLTTPLLAEVLRKVAKDVLILEETQERIVEGMKTNTGQCIPINAIVKEYKDLIISNNLDPEKVTLWIPRSDWACNIRLYPYYIKSLLEAEGNGLEKAGVYLGNITQIEFGPQTSILTYLAYLFGGILHKFGCHYRPYEKVPGTTEQIILQGLEIFRLAFKGEISYRDAIEKNLELFRKIEVNYEPKPKVAIFGDLYIRDNPVMNQGLIKFIEENGGEVVVTPYNEYTKIIAYSYFKSWMKELKIIDYLLYRSLLSVIEFIDGIYYSPFENYIGKTVSSKNKHIEKQLSNFNLRIEQEGETKDNILKVYYLLQNYPDLSLLVHTSPAFCCPSLITESLCRKIEKIFNIPVVNIIYDGTNTFKNDIIIPYLKYSKTINPIANNVEILKFIN